MEHRVPYLSLGLPHAEAALKSLIPPEGCTDARLARYTVSTDGVQGSSAPRSVNAAGSGLLPSHRKVVLTQLSTDTRALQPANTGVGA